jgi:hypothetical protein
MSMESDLFPPHKCGLYLTHNEHRDYYQSVEAWDLAYGGDDWLSDDERQRAIDTNEMWAIQWHPDTPSSCYRVLASSLDAVLRAAKQMG